MRSNADSPAGLPADAAAKDHKTPVCAVDVGSKNLKVVIGECSNGRVRTRLLAKTTLALGKEVAGHGRVRQRKLDDLANALSDCVDRCRACGAHTILGIATSAVRRAENRDAVTALAAGLGVDLHVADATREAVVGYLAASLGVPGKIVSDFGSESFQVAWWLGPEIATRSVDMGYESAYQNFIAPAESFAQARRRFRVYLESRLGMLPTEVDEYIALSAKSMAGFVLGRHKDAVGSALSGDALRRKIKHLEALSEDAFEMLKARTEKASKVLAGIIAVDYVMERSGQRKVRVEDAELPVGLIVEFFGMMSARGATRTMKME